MCDRDTYCMVRIWVPIMNVRTANNKCPGAKLCGHARSAALIIAHSYRFYRGVHLKR